MHLPRIEGQNLVVQPASPGDMEKPVSPSDIQYLPASTPVEASARTHHAHFSSNECWSRSGFSSNVSNDDETFRYAFSVAMDNDDMLECLLNFPDVKDNTSHLHDFQALASAQAQGAGLQHKLQMDPTWYTRRIFDTRVNLIVVASLPTVWWRICWEAGSDDPLVSYGAQSCWYESTQRNDDDALLP